jgi:hypothetical protein
MRLIIILLFFFFPITLHAQIVYKGSILNRATRSAIPFATIGLIKANSGINADEQGNFSLSVNKYDNDTIVISCVGYKTLKVPIVQYPSNRQFELTENQFTLSEVIIGKNYNGSQSLNEFSNCGNSSYTTIGHITQVAVHFQSPVPNSMLSEISICKRNDNSLFRIRVYARDSVLGKPSIDLVDTIIEVKSKRKHVNIDLEKYNIIIPEKDFFVAIEWIKIPYNESKIKIKYNGKKTIQTQYSPSIFFKERDVSITDSNNPLDIWHLTYQGRWIKFFPKDGILLLSAKVKY